MAANSALANYSSVVQQQPALSLATSPSGFTASWLASGVGFRLYSTVNLTTPTIWTPSSAVPVLTNGQWQLTLPADNTGTRFYRLQF